MRLTLFLKQSLQSNIHKAISIVRRRFHQKIKRKYKPKGDDDPAGLKGIPKIAIAAEFIEIDKLGLFYSYGHFVGCRSPPPVLHFLDLKNLEMEDKLMKEHEKEYTLLVGGKRIPVSEKVYKAYYQCRDREKYLDKLASHNNISLEDCVEEGIQVEHEIASVKMSMEDAIVDRESIEKMRKCLSLLDLSERRLIEALFFEDMSEHQFSKRTGIAQRTINDQKRRILSKLKKLMEK